MEIINAFLKKKGVCKLRVGANMDTPPSFPFYKEEGGMQIKSWADITPDRRQLKL